MQTISLKSNSPDTVIPILKIALKREKHILENTLSVTKEKIDRLAKELNIDVGQLMRGEVAHSDSNDMQLIELEGEIEIRKQLEVELRELELVEICK